MKIELGTAQFGLPYGISNKTGKVSQSEVIKILNYAHKVGISDIDTAPLYGCSEDVVGKNLGNFDWNIITKTPYFSHMEIDNNDIYLLNRSVEKSLLNLNRKKIKGILVHSCNDLIKPNGFKIFHELCKFKESGIIDKVGVSVYNCSQIDRIIDNFDIDIMQLPVSIIDQRLVHSGHLSILKKHNIEIHARSVFLQGLLLMSKSEQPDYFNPMQDKLDQFRLACNELSLKPLDLSLSFVQNLHEVDKIVVGVESLNQFKQIIKATKNKINSANYHYLSVQESKFVNPSEWEKK